LKHNDPNALRGEHGGALMRFLQVRGIAVVWIAALENYLALDCGLVSRYYLRYGPVDVLDGSPRLITLYGTARVRKLILLGAYVARRTADGLSTKEIQRCLKRYIVRELYPLILAGLADCRVQT